MKFANALMNMTTAIVLIAIDNQASGADGLTNYGDLMRMVVWAIVIWNGARVAYFARDCMEEVTA